MTPSRYVAYALAGTLALGVAACVVDVGPDTGPPQGCNAPAPFFVTDVWPQYFDKYSCGKSDCHDSVTGHGYFRLENVMAVTAPDPTSPVSTWPTSWQNNFRAVQRGLSCANPTISQVLAVPSGRAQPHPPGVTVLDIPAADTLFTTWLK